MIAYFVHDEKKQSDLLIVPATDTMVPIDRVLLETFISVAPDFSSIAGQRLNGLPPESFGRIVASRDSDGDVCILAESLWRQCMASHLGLADR